MLRRGRLIVTVFMAIGILFIGGAAPARDFFAYPMEPAKQPIMAIVDLCLPKSGELCVNSVELVHDDKIVNSVERKSGMRWSEWPSFPDNKSLDGVSLLQSSDGGSEYTARCRVVFNPPPSPQIKDAFSNSDLLCTQFIKLLESHKPIKQNDIIFASLYNKGIGNEVSGFAVTGLKLNP